jgi:nitrite reductase (NADH) large subunit
MTQLKISGIQLFSCGQIDPPAARCLTMADLDAGIYKKLWLDEGAVVGAVMIGDTSGGLALFEHLMAQSKPAQGGFELLLGH